MGLLKDSEWNFFKSGVEFPSVLACCQILSLRLVQDLQSKSFILRDTFVRISFRLVILSLICGDRLQRDLTRLYGILLMGRHFARGGGIMFNS